MPVQVPKKINVLDLNPNIGIGISLPFDNKKIFNTTYTTQEQIRSNLINFLLTNPGERIMNPNFGSGLRSLLFSQIDDLSVIKDVIQDKLNLYFPNVNVLDIGVTGDIDNHYIKITLTYQLQTNLITDTIQLNVNF